jgi:ribosome maturation factor RimP
MVSVYNTQREKELAFLLSNEIDKDGYEIIRIRTYKNKTGKKCQIMIDTIDDTQVKISDCENVNKVLIELLSNNDLGLEDHSIEVSSPGIDRPLTRLKDFNKNKGRLIKVYTLFKVFNRKSFKGYLKEINADSISIMPIDNNEIVDIRFDSISEAYLQYEHNK